ncbi:MAG: GDP-mannose 4,6-dehydratase [Candidatus Micrarchaeota archaeon]|nr:GDP-mannose 4,6-dehydratase [Candidatus Micrarchaeota archaeon]
MISGENILVTGGAGYIGSHLVDALVEKNRVTVLDNLSTGKISNIQHNLKRKGFHFIKGNVEDAETLRKAAMGCSIIVHEAAVVGVKHYVKDPLKVLLVNSLGMENVLEVARKTDAKVVFASTSEVYGKSETLPLRENGDRLLGSTSIDRWCYSTSKAFDEHLCFGYYKKYSLPVVILRYFNSYGPRADGSEYGGVIPIFINRVLRNKAPQVHGDGKQTRCFTYISDTVAGTMLSLEKKGAVGEIINIGTNVETPIVELAGRIIDLSGEKMKPEFITHEKFYGKSYEDIRRRVPDISKAKKLLGWEPRVDFEDGLRRTIAWYKKVIR